MQQSENPLYGQSETMIRGVVRWGLYPASWAIILFGFHRIIALGEPPRTVWMQSTGVLLPLYLVVEIMLPYQGRWSMTRATLWADLKFVVLNGASGALISAGLAFFAINTAGDHIGPATDWPVAGQLLACLLIFEAVNYALHRAMHELGGFDVWKIPSAVQHPDCVAHGHSDRRHQTCGCLGRTAIGVQHGDGRGRGEAG